MPPFRFNIPFFSFGSPSRISSGTSSPSPPPTPPPSRPPFRPAGIAQPSKSATSYKVPSSLSRAKSNGAAIAASSTSRGVDQLEKQSNQSGSPLKKEEQKVMMKEKPLRESAKEAEEQRKKTEVEKLAMEERVSKAAQEQQKRKETEKLAVEEKKKALHKDMEENSIKAQEQEKRKETEKLAAEEKKKALHKDMKESSKTELEQEKRKDTEKLAAEEKKKALRNNMQDNSKTEQDQLKRKETEKHLLEEKKKALRNDMQESSKTAQEQEKRKETEKLAIQERDKTLQTVGKEDATQRKPTQQIAKTSESTRESRDLLERDRTKIHTDENNPKAKGDSTSKHGPPNVKESSLMSRRIKEDIRDGISKLTWGKSNNNEKSVSVFTLTGENRGATMSIGSEKDKKDDEIHIHRGYRTNPNESPNLIGTESQEERRHKNPKEGEARVKAYVNGNTQGINNSIVCESSVGENDPGVHMSFRFEVTKKEVINSEPEKKTETVKQRNEPRVRRRCLRGLLAESSESENPLKPRRHGCRFTCKDKAIEDT